MKKRFITLIIIGLVLVTSTMSYGYAESVSDVTEILGTWQRKFSSDFDGEMDVATLQFDDNEKGKEMITSLYESNKHENEVTYYRWQQMQNEIVIKHDYDSSSPLQYGILEDCMYLEISGLFSRNPNALIVYPLEGKLDVHELPNTQSPIITRYDLEFLALGRVGNFTKVFLMGYDGLHIGYVEGFPFVLQQGFTDYEGSTYDGVLASVDMVPLLAEDALISDNTPENTETAIYKDEPVETQIINNGETWEFVAVDGILPFFLSVERNDSLLSYIVQESSGDIFSQHYRQSLQRDDYIYSSEFGFVEVLPLEGNTHKITIPAGGKTVMTLDEDTSGPIEVQYDPRYISVVRSESSVLRSFNLQSGVVYEVHNNRDDTTTLCWDPQEGLLNYFIFKGDTLIYSELDIDTQKKTSLSLDSNCRVLLYLNRDTIPSLMMYRPNIANLDVLTEEYLRNINLISPGEEYEFYNMNTYKDKMDPGSSELKLGYKNDMHIFYKVFNRDGQIVNEDMGTYLDNSILIPAEGRAVISIPETQQDKLLVYYQGENIRYYSKDIKSIIAGMRNGQLTLRDNVLSLFDEYNFVSEYINNISFMEGFAYGIVNWKDVVLSFLVGRFNTDAMADYFMKNPEKINALLKTILDRLLKPVTYDYIDQANDILKTSKSMANYATLVNTIIEKKRIKISSPGYASDFVETLEFISPFLKNYDNHVQVLNLLMRASKDYGELMRSSINALLMDYQYKLIPSMIEKAATEMTGQSIEAMLDFMIDGFSGNTKIITYLIDDVFGMSPMLEGLDTVFCLTPIKYSLINIYKNVAKHILDGNTDTDSIQDYILLFNVCKECIILEYESMLIKYKGEPWSMELSYLNSQLESLRKMNFYEYSFAIPFEQYKTKDRTVLEFSLFPEM